MRWILVRVSLVAVIAIGTLSVYQLAHRQAHALTSPSSGTLYGIAGNYNNGSPYEYLESIDPASNIATRLGPNLDTVSGGYTQGVSALDAAGHRYFVAGVAPADGSTLIFALDTQSGAVLSQTPLPDYPTSLQFAPTVVTIQTVIAQINADVASEAIDNSEVANSLLAKLGKSSGYLAATDCGNYRVSLNAFINEVEAQSGKHIAINAANTLIADAQSLASHC
jgi:hypothetical protein